MRRHSFLYLFYTPATRNMTLSENDTTNPSYFFPFEKINLVTTDLLHHQLLLWIPVLLSHICVLLLQLPLSWCPTSISGGIQNLNPKLGLYFVTSYFGNHPSEDKILKKARFTKCGIPGPKYILHVYVLYIFAED